MRTFLNKSFISIFTSLLISGVLFTLSDVAFTLKLSVLFMLFSFALWILIFGKIMKSLFAKLKQNNEKIESIVNSLHTMHSKIESVSTGVDNNNTRGRKILEIVDEDLKLNSAYIENARDLNYRLGSLVNQKKR